ncbi:MAG: heme-binding domain-containing protein [Vicinamibacterales bacterium]
MRLRPAPLITAAVLVFIALQAFNPSGSNPPSDPSLHLRALVPAGDPALAVLDRACRDCHSNETEWPGYSRIAPVSWFVARHVRDGRRELNLSEFGSYNDRKRRRKLEEVCEQVEKGDMPLASYLLLHPAARLQPADVTLLCGLKVPGTVRLDAPAVVP